MENRLDKCNRNANDVVTLAEVDKKCKKLEDMLNYRIKRECVRIQQKLELSKQDLGHSMVICLKRRDVQLNAKFQTLIPLKSTLIRPTLNSILLPSVSQAHMSVSGRMSEFSNFNSSEDDDPVTFIERCEEYLAIQPLSDFEILASLTSVLQDSAKDWWVAEKRNVQT